MPTEPHRHYGDPGETHTYWTSIGRNVGTVTLADDDWQAFTDDLLSLVCGIPSTDIIDDVLDGRSSWEGVPEDSYLILFTIDDHHLADLRSELARLAKQYRQDGIGLVGGPGTDTVVRP